MSTAAELDVTIEQTIDAIPVSSLSECDLEDLDGPYVLQASVVRNVNIPAHVFVFLRESVGPPAVDRFCKVATVSDMDNITAGAPGAGESQFRATTLELRFDTLQEMFDFNDTLLSMLDQLLVDWNRRNEEFASSTTYTFPL